MRRSLHPGAKRVLFMDRLVRPWADDELIYRTMSRYLSSWTREREERLELFRIGGRGLARDCQAGGLVKREELEKRGDLRTCAGFATKSGHKLLAGSDRMSDQCAPRRTRLN